MSSWIKLEGGNFPTFFVWVGLSILWFWEGFVWCTNGVQLPSGQSGLWCLVVDGDWSHLQKQREKKTMEESEYWEPSFNSLRWGVHRGFSGSTLRALLYYSEPQNTFAMVCYWCHKGNRTEGTRETDGITWDRRQYTYIDRCTKRRSSITDRQMFLQEEPFCCAANYSSPFIFLCIIWNNCQMHEGQQMFLQGGVFCCGSLAITGGKNTVWVPLMAPIYCLIVRISINRN